MNGDEVEVFGLDGSFVRQWDGKGGGIVIIGLGEVFVASMHATIAFKFSDEHSRMRMTPHPTARLSSCP